MYYFILISVMEVSEKSVLTPRFDSFELQIITDVIKHGKVRYYF